MSTTRGLTRICALETSTKQRFRKSQRQPPKPQCSPTAGAGRWTPARRAASTLSSLHLPEAGVKFSATMLADKFDQSHGG